MKKMILKAAACAALATAMVLTGCSSDGGGDSDIIQTSGNTKASVDYTNETGDYARGFKTINFSHSMVECDIVMKNVSDAKASAMGLVFGYSAGENAGETLHNFYRISVKNKSSKTDGPCYYIDYINGQPDSTISGGDGTKYEKTVKGFTEFSKSPVTNGTLTVKVSVSEAEDGSLLVNFKDAAGGDLGSFIEGTSTAGWTKKTEGKAGYYVLVEDGATLTGNWTITDTKAAEIVEE